MMIIKARNIITEFGSKCVHNDVSFEVKENGIFSILGGSGNGKSVLLKQMLLSEYFDSGEYEVLDFKLKSINEENAQILRSKRGVVFRFTALFSFFSVFENIAIPLKEYINLNGEAIEELVMMKLKMVGLNEDILKQYPSELSGGIQKGVAIARALALDSRLLFLDEPTSGLDPYSSCEFDDLVLKLKQGPDLNIILVAHDEESMKSILDRFIILEDKKVAFCDTFSELRVQNERLFRRFME